MASQAQGGGQGVGQGVVAAGIEPMLSAPPAAFKPLEMCVIYAERCATEFCELGQGATRDCMLALSLEELQRHLPVYERADPNNLCFLVGDRLYGANDANRHLCDPAAMRARAQAAEPAVTPCDTGFIAVAAPTAADPAQFSVRCVPQPVIKVEVTRAAPPEERVVSYQ